MKRTQSPHKESKAEDPPGLLNLTFGILRTVAILFAAGYILISACSRPSQQIQTTPPANGSER